MSSSQIHKLLVTSFLLLASLPGRSQINNTNPFPKFGTIRGQVRLPDGRPAAMGYAVYLEMSTGGTANQTQTDRQGKFQFEQVPQATYLVRVRAPGYVDHQQSVDLLTITQAYVDVTLQPDKNALGSGASNALAGGTVSALDANAPPEARKNVEDGQALLASGKDIDKSINLFKKATSTYPQYEQAYLLMGVAYSAQKKWDDAEKALQKATDLNRNNAAALVALGGVENEKHNFNDAEKYLSNAVALAPESADAQFELAQSYWALGKWEAAEPHVTKAIDVRPKHAGEHLLLGNILLRKRNAPGALKEYQEALRLDPKGPMAEPTRQMVEKIENALKSSKK